MKTPGQGVVHFTATHTKKDGTVVEYSGTQDTQNNNVYLRLVRKVLNNANRRSPNPHGEGEDSEQS